jgi:two-component system, OmpR family, response regulator
VTVKLERILLVDDETDIRTVAAMALSSLGGFAVETSASGPEALARVSSWAPQLVLLDVMMPGMDGPATLAAMRERCGPVVPPVAFMTAKVEPEEVARLEELGAIGVIAKPFDPMTLAEAVQAVWDARHGV